MKNKIMLKMFVTALILYGAHADAMSLRHIKAGLAKTSLAQRVKLGSMPIRKNSSWTGSDDLSGIAKGLAYTVGSSFGLYVFEKEVFGKDVGLSDMGATIGIEKDEKYFSIAENRISST